MRRIEPRDAEVLRELRLRALREEPLSFGSTYEREAEYTDEWEAWARDDAEGGDCATFFALDEERQPLGLAAGYREPDDPDVFNLIAMWIEPDWRRQGRGGRLVEEVAGWAAAWGGTTLRLWVTDGRAAALYRKHNFHDDGRRQPLPHAPEVIETGMTRSLARAAQPPPAPPGALSL